MIATQGGHLAGAGKGQLAAVLPTAVIVLAAAAYASNPPPAPTHALSVRGVFDCGLSVMMGSGWEVASPPGGPVTAQGVEPEYMIALLQRGDNYINLAVRRTDRGNITVDVGRHRPKPEPLAEADQLKQQIATRCMS